MFVVCCLLFVVCISGFVFREGCLTLCVGWVGLVDCWWVVGGAYGWWLVDILYLFSYVITLVVGWV